MHIYACTHTGGYKCHVMHYVVCVLYVVCLHVCCLHGGTCVYVACVLCMLHVCCVCACRYVCSVCVVYVGGCMWGLVADILSYIASHFIF